MNGQHPILLAALAGALAAPASAVAGPVEDSTAIGVAFWAARGVTVPPSVQVAAVEVPCGMTDIAGCAIGNIRVEVPAALVRSRTRVARVELCSTIAHELGHTAGLGHTATGLMSPYGEADPWACRVWAARTTARRSRNAR